MVVESVDVVVVGGGVAGLATAWRLAERGVRRVLLVEAEPLFASHASARNAAIWLPHESDATTAAAARRSAELLDGLLGPWRWRAPVPAWLTASAAETLRAPVQVAERAGLTVEPIVTRADRVPDALLEAVPPLRGGVVRAGARVHGAAVMDVHAMVEAIARAARRAGAELRRATAAVGIERDARERPVVRLAGGGAVHCERVVLATGAWASEADRLAGVGRPLRPLRRHLVVLQWPGHERLPLLWHLGEGQLYVRPETGGLLCSPCDEEPWPAGAPPTAEDVAERVAERIVPVLPGLAEARARRSWACLRTFAPDRELVLGPEPAWPRMCWNVGHGGRGMTVAVGAADWLAEALLGDVPLPEAVLPGRLSA